MSQRPSAPSYPATWHQTASYPEEPPAQSQPQAPTVIQYHSQESADASYPPAPVSRQQLGPRPAINSIQGFFDYLDQVTSLRFVERLDLPDTFLGVLSQTVFAISDQSGQIVLSASEDSHCCARQFFTNSRSFEFEIKDSYGNLVLRLVRQLNCSCFCGLLCPDSASVILPDGQILGHIEEKASLWPHFKIKNAQRKTIMQIKGPLIRSGCCCQEIVFEIRDSRDLSSMGTLVKQWSGFMQEFFTHADNFHLSFHSHNCTPEMKALLMASVLLIVSVLFD